ncbi:MAG TPA: hypothetical protein VHS58_08960 [Acetobacteraceae bacterium]|jgi:hypothetical protein|nr:hypothetical protein [Acetobacteraceae bacterium]
MNLPLALPAWLPWWVPVAVLIPALLYALLFLLMPFSVFGVKGRLDVIEARLDEIQGEIRALILRLPEGDPSYLDSPDSEPPLRQDGPPPVPPRREARIVSPADDARRRTGREEPRLDWPGQPR